MPSHNFKSVTRNSSLIATSILYAKFGKFRKTLYSFFNAQPFPEGSRFPRYIVMPTNIKQWVWLISLSSLSYKPPNKEKVLVFYNIITSVFKDNCMQTKYSVGS